MRPYVITFCLLVTFAHYHSYAISKKAETYEEKDGETLSEGLEIMGKDIERFGEKFASRIDRIIKRKTFEFWGDPWTVQGIPLIFPSSSSGFNLGLRVALTNIRRQDPHKLSLESQLMTSDKGRYKHFLKIDYPRAFDGRFRVTTRISYDRDITFRYFGISNDTEVDKALIDRDDVFYQNVRAGPTFTFQILRNFSRNLRIGPIIGFKWTDITAPPGSLLLAESPVGIAGGKTHYIGVAFVYDTTDFEPYPSRGNVHELYFYWYAPWLGSSYDFVRATYTFRKYFPLHRTLTLAHRTLLETLSGTIPFYELGGVGGSSPTIGFGGDKFLRGYDSNRFIDRIKFVTGFELRWDPIVFNFAKQDISIGFVPFVDIGRVFPAVFPLTFSNFHASTGWGLRIIWNSRFIIRADYALNADGTAFILNLGNSF